MLIAQLPHSMHASMRKTGLEKRATSKRERVGGIHSKNVSVRRTLGGSRKGLLESKAVREVNIENEARWRRREAKDACNCPE